ncbi:TPA: hypothetical protein J6O31_002931 [Escherichia coli]|uniref:DUF6950 family protein n=1 Tax=Escherichia coli TaxID=562 RepID=UPI0007752F86|nr:hypothetical protein [Escherichia coli]EEW7495314.1 hypothetical protein [Escherichia albertii]EEX4920927.1 hypothetical protein [Escherichia albertii]EFH5366520.1 hypothetical protein [Escherichia coli]EFJ2285687.1 hypothetical protein [Escherichia albertii]EFO0110407.1 hypothetical protein [Escherichia albertii]
MNGFITEYLSTLIGQPIVYGENDCHIMSLTVIDMLLGTNYRDEIYQRYTSPTGGRKYAKEHCSYKSLNALCNDLGTKQVEPFDGDILITGSQSTVYWRGKVIISIDGVYAVMKYEPIENNYKIYRFGGK